MKIYHGNASKKLSERVIWYRADGFLNFQKIYQHQFPSGEQYCQYKDNVKDEDVVLIQSTSFPTNDNLMQLLVMSDAARRSGAKSITAVIPYFGYSRQDRNDKFGTPISAKLVMDLLNASGINKVITFDLHAPQIGGFANFPIVQLSFESVLMDYITTKYDYRNLKNNVVVVAPDVGAVKRGEHLAEMIGCDFAFISKKRIGDDTVKLTNFVGDVKNKTVIIFDDLTESCGTLVQAAIECKQQGATKVICAVTHFCITDVGMDRLVENMYHPNIKDRSVYIDEFVHSDTVNTWWKLKYKPADINELSVAELISLEISKL